MRLIATWLVIATGLVVMGCGGMPEPQIESVEPRADATLVRVSMVATNYDTSWDNENLRLRTHQIWLNDAGVPTAKEQVFEQAFEGKQGANRGTIKMKDSDGNSDTDVRLSFELVSGENPSSENISAGTTLEWDIPSNMAEKDIIFLVVVSRKARNNYAIDVLYAVNPETGEIEQVLPSYDAQ